METNEEFHEKLNALLDDTDDRIKETHNYLISKGVIVNLNEWVTIKKYSEMFRIKNIETISNWINRGIIPAENVRVLGEFNNIRIIKAVPYNAKQ